MKRLLMAACVASLAACGADSEEHEVTQKYQQEWEALKASVIYSFPADDQEQVPTSSPVVLRFSTPVVDTAPAITVREAGGPDLTISSYEWADAKQSLVLGVEGGFDPMTEYEVVVPAINLEKGTTNERTINFTTAALEEGATSQLGADTFSIIRTIPDNQGFDIVTDMSTFRVQFSQPLNRDTIDYGTNVKLTTAAGVPVEAHVLVDGPYLTVDPKADLSPSQQYTLTVTTGVQGISGDALGSDYAIAFTPADTTSPTTGERSLMIQNIADSENGARVSPFTGAPINLIPMASTLLGDDTATQSSGVIAAELAFAPNFPEITPLRIPRGMLMRGESIDVLIGGSVDAGPTLPESGEVTITFLSDATGYMIPNPYSDSDFAPRLIHLYMDVGVSTDRAAANGAITQTIQHIELVGTAIVKNGALEVNAVGMVEPKVLGAESAEGLLAFYMKAFDDQDNAPAVEQDTAALEVQSWSIAEAEMEGDTDTSVMAGPGDPIVANFNKPLDPGSVEGQVTVRSTAQFEPDPEDPEKEIVVIGTELLPIDADITVDGAAVIVRPRHPVDYSPENSPLIYEVTLGENIADVHGNELGIGATNQFKLKVLPENKTPVRASNFSPWNQILEQAPVVLATQPGYPCAIDAATTDLASNVAGRCAGANLGTPDHAVTGYPVAHVPDSVPADDLLPVTTLPANRPIAIAFSQAIDPASVIAGETFVVEQSADNGATWTNVDGRVEVSGRDLRFYPDQPWSEGGLYRYTVVSAGYIENNPDNYTGQQFGPVQDYSCDGSSGTHVMCSKGLTPDGRQLPIQTQVLGPRDTIELPTASNVDNGWPYPAQPTPVADLECANPEVEGDPTSCPEYANFGQFADWYRTWGVVGAGVLWDAGGPSMVQHFRGGPKTENVLQALKQAPVADVNANFYWERDLDMEVVVDYRERIHPAIGVFATGPVNDRAYTYDPQAAEPGPTDELMMYENLTYAQYDPNGLKPGPNMTKMIMWPVVDPGDLPATLTPDSPGGTYAMGSDVNIGCGYQGSVDDPFTFRKASSETRKQCPERQFTPLTSALFAEVTDEKNAEGDVKVLIWPGVIIAASMDIVAAFNSNPGGDMEHVGDPVKLSQMTGRQVMRMRFAENASGERTELIEAWIRETPDGPVLEADVDLYIDAPRLSQLGIIADAAHTLNGYPVSMHLSGPVEFLDDGRMVVVQKNTHDVELDLEAAGPGGRFVAKLNIAIPEEGAYLQYISEPIK